MNTKEAIKFLENGIDMSAKKTGIQLEKEYLTKMDGVYTLLKRGEINQRIIDKMKNEKYDVWISLPGSFTNIPKFIRDIEKEVNNAN